MPQPDPLPRLTETLLREWALTPDGTPLEGVDAVVTPVRTETGDAAVLKVGRPGGAAAGEIPALKVWGGVGAVRLLRSDPRRHALLLERLGEDLGGEDVLQACGVIGGLYGRLHRLPDPRVPELTPVIERGLDGLVRAGRGLPVPPRLVRHTLAVAPGLLRDGPRAVLHGDLHSGTVLRRREEWAAVAPRGLVGDPAYEVAPLLWHRTGEPAWQPAADAVLARFFAAVDAAGLDPVRARDWSVLRCVLALAASAPAPGAPGRGDEGDTPVALWTTRWVTAAKALLADAL